MKTTSVRRFVVVVLLAILVSFVTLGCSQRGDDDSSLSPTAPTPPNVGWNPSKPIDINNRPPSPPEGLSLATATYALYRGDCAEDVTKCDALEKIEPTTDPAMKVSPSEDETFVVGTYRYISGWRMRYTLVQCVTHRQWAGRQLSVTVMVGTNPTGYRNQMFDEGDSSKTSPVCIGASFDFMLGEAQVTDTRGGFVSFIESHYDLLVTNTWRRNFGFRILRQQ